jgi:hypothetical protein
MRGNKLKTIKSKKMKKLGLIVALSLLVSVTIFQSCTKQNEMEALQIPKIPETKMMVMDFNGFDTVDPNQRSFSNWFHAAVNVYFWTRTVAEVIKVPVVAFVAAVNQQAQYQGNDTWMWSLDINDNGQEYLVRLYGTLDMVNQEVDWAMYVTAVGVFEDYLWVTGSTAYDESYSNFTLNAFANEEGGDYSPVEFLLIEYAQDLNTETEGIRYTIVLPDNEASGSYIQYGTSVSNEFPVYYDIYLEAESNTTNILYNPATKYGKVKDPKRFHDEDWHCWDDHGNDIDC